MTSPLSAPPGGIPAAPTQVVGGGGLDLSLIVQILAQTAAKKQRKAEEAVQGIPEGVPYGQLTPDQQKQYARATGVKDLKPDTIVRPLPATSPEATLGRLKRSLGIGVGSPLDIGLTAAMAGQVATGAPHALTTPEGLTSEAAASADVASARRVEAGSFRSATDKAAAAPVGANVEYTPSEIAAVKRFNDFVPSEPIAAQLTGQTRAAIMKEALRVASDPNATSWAGLLPSGVKPADVIGGIALGAGDIITSGANRRNIIETTYAQEAARALYGAAEAASKSMGGRYSPDFIAHVMQGDAKAIDSPAGQMVSRFMDAGFMAALTEAGTKGDPGSIAMQRLLELGRIPQIASNEEVLAQYSNLLRQVLAGSITRAHLGFDRPTESGDSQKLWDQYNAAIGKQMGGLFRTSAQFGPFGGNLTIEGANQPFGTEPAKTQQQRDSELLSQSLQAIFGDSTGRAGPTIPTGTGSPFDIKVPAPAVPAVKPRRP